MIEGGAPVVNGHGPFLTDITQGQKEQLGESLVRRESGAGLENFTQRAIDDLNRVGSINDAPN